MEVFGERSIPGSGRHILGEPALEPHIFIAETMAQQSNESP